MIIWLSMIDRKQSVLFHECSAMLIDPFKTNLSPVQQHTCCYLSTFPLFGEHLLHVETLSPSSVKISSYERMRCLCAGGYQQPHCPVRITLRDKLHWSGCGVACLRPTFLQVGTTQFSPLSVIGHSLFYTLPLLRLILSWNLIHLVGSTRWIRFHPGIIHWSSASCKGSTVYFRNRICSVGFWTWSWLRWALFGTFWYLCAQCTVQRSWVGQGCCLSFQCLVQIHHFPDETEWGREALLNSVAWVGTLLLCGSQTKDKEDWWSTIGSHWAG